MPDHLDPFWVDEEHDRHSASDGDSRYGVYLRQSRTMSDYEPDERKDPVRFAEAVWSVATGPVMSPPYVRWAPRIASARCYRNQWDGSLVAHLTLYSPRPAQLREMRGFSDWGRHYNHYSATEGFHEPSEESLSRRPAILTTTRLLLPLRADGLYVPGDAPDQISARDAKAAVAAVVGLLNEQVAPILAALER